MGTGLGRFRRGFGLEASVDAQAGLAVAPGEVCGCGRSLDANPDGAARRSVSRGPKPGSRLTSAPDMPPQANGMPTYSKADAERAWGELLALYKSALA